MNRIIRFFLENRLVTFLVLVAFIAWGIATAPFGWKTGLPADPVPVDAIPDLGENQQIVYTEWAGRSPQDMEDQVGYPLTTALMGIPGVKTIRSNSIFGLSSIYLIFEEGVEFYWSRSRILEKLNSLPAGTLPDGVVPALGPDATALGQIYWYTLEGRDADGQPAGGWDPQELRSIQDFYVRYGLMAAPGVAEVASVGGFVREYQVDIDPLKMKTFNVTVPQIMAAVKNSNLDIGARTIEFNRAEYVVRSLGYVKSLSDLEESVVTQRDHVAVRIKDVAKVNVGPAPRRGGLDKDGVEAVGGVVVARYGSNPLEVINNVKAKIEEIAPGLPSKTLSDGTVSKVTVVPFYDRTGLIKETLGTLEEALTLEVLISIIVVIVLILNLKASILISSLLPIGVLMTFITMRYAGVDANIVALSGIAIAIGVMVDVGVVFTENIQKFFEAHPSDHPRGKALVQVIYEATAEVAPAVVTALSTTIVSFLPVFFLQAAEGKLFRPLAFTKTFAMLSALLIGLIIIPTLAYWLFGLRADRRRIKYAGNGLLMLSGLVMLFIEFRFPWLILIVLGLYNLLEERIPQAYQHWTKYLNPALVLIAVIYFLTINWLPLGAQNSLFGNFLFVFLLLALVLVSLSAVVKYYPALLGWALRNKGKFLAIPVTFIVLGATIWVGFDSMFGWMRKGSESIGVHLDETRWWQTMDETFPGLGREFMPKLDEGSFLLMPTTMPHSGIEENLEVIGLLDRKVAAIPEVEMVVGKWGRVNSALDPAPVSMYENVINYRPEYILNESGHRMRFKTNKEDAFMLKDGSTYDPAKDAYRTIEKEALIPDRNGEYFRQWRPEIQSPDDIWNAIIDAAKIPGLTSAPRLQPIETRLVMLQTGMRAPMGIKVFGPDLASIEKVGLELEEHLKKVEGVEPNSVFADRVVGKPYIEIKPDRKKMARYGLTIQAFQKQLSSLLGGMALTTSVEGRERYPIRVRYAREYRDDPEAIKRLLISVSGGLSIPLAQLATVDYTRGPQMIRSEDTFLVGYVIFDKKTGYAETDVVENAQDYLNHLMQNDSWQLPGGVKYKFTGNYENQIRATKRLMIVIPISLLIIFLILYFQFRSTMVTSMIFSGIVVAFSGGFIMLWLYGQEWFMNFSIGTLNMRDLFQMGTINISVAVWVGFIALFGIATDDGVLMGTYLNQVFGKKQARSVAEVRSMVLEAGLKRVRPAMMTTATTIIALIPVVTSQGKGSDIMVPMAIPALGGMLIEVFTIFVVPVLYSMWKERKMTKTKYS